MKIAGRFSVKVSGDFNVNERHVDVKKLHRYERTVRCKFDGGVNVVDHELSSKGLLEVFYCVCPYHENVIYVTPPRVRVVIIKEHVKERLFQIWRETDSSHGSTVYL